MEYLLKLKYFNLLITYKQEQFYCELQPYAVNHFN